MMSTPTIALPSPITPHLIVRIATHADATSIASIGAATFTSSAGHSVSASDLSTYLHENYTPSVITAALLDPSNTFLVAQHPPSSDIIGFIQLKYNTTEPCLPADKRLVELHRIYMHNQVTGQGFGGVFIEKAHEFARERGFEGVWLGVWVEHLRQGRFYERAGYERVGFHDFAVGKEVQRDYIMLKKL